MMGRIITVADSANGDSVQETLMRALSTFLRQEIEVVGAGRTDAGVHARLMIAHLIMTGSWIVFR